MIVNFRHKGLEELWQVGRSGKLDQRFHKRILVRLDRLDVAESLIELNLPGFDFHPLKGFDPTRYSIHVNGPWCLTFAFQDGEASNVDFEQYH